jgi:hypothetical protein
MIVAGAGMPRCRPCGTRFQFWDLPRGANAELLWS